LVSEDDVVCEIRFRYRGMFPGCCNVGLIDIFGIVKKIYFQTNYFKIFSRAI